MENKETILDQSFFVTGETGTGKTFWAREKYNEAKKYWDQVRDFQSLTTSQAVLFKSYPELCVRVKNFKFADDILDSLLHAKFLVLDDFFGSRNEGFNPIAYIVINFRVENNRATIVTSNMSLDQIGEIDDRVASRLATFQRVLFKGGDMRLNKTEPIVIDNRVNKGV